MTRVPTASRAGVVRADDAVPLLAHGPVPA